MNKRKRIGTDETKNSGVTIEYVKSKKMLYIYGWHDGFVGIEPVQYTLDEFCKQLDIRKKGTKR